MPRHCVLILGLSGFIILILGIICSWYIFPMLIKQGIADNIALKEGTYAYQTWKKQPFPMHFKVYFFNVTNADEVQQGAKPIVKEIGPYIYNEYRERVNIAVNEQADTLTYMLKKTYFFNAKETGCRDDSDVVTILNAAIVGTALQVDQMMPTALGTISEAIPYLYPGSKDIFLRASVKDILFDGITIHCTDDEVEFVCGAMKSVLPKTIRQADGSPNFIFSLFGHLNNSLIGPWEMGRGLQNTTRGDVYAFNDEKVMDKWYGSTCNMINGSDSSVFSPPPTPRPQRLYSFADDFCRSLYVTYEKETSLFGLEAVRYSTTEDSLAISAANNCFCPRKESDEGTEELQCPPSGLTDMTPCLKAQIMVSYPHFYLADKSLLEFVSGLSPNKDAHENFVVLEPLTATPLEGRKRIQMNMYVKRLEAFELLANVSDGYLPFIWLEEGVKLPEDVVLMLHANFGKMAILDVVKWCLIVLGLVVMASSFVVVIYRERLLCFANMGSVPITNRSVNAAHLSLGHVNPVTVSDSLDVEYPTSLYPQVANKDVSDSTTNRRHQWNSTAWQQ